MLSLALMFKQANQSFLCFLRMLGGSVLTIGLLCGLTLIVVLGIVVQVTRGMQVAQLTVFESWFFMVGGFFPIPGIRFVLLLLGLNQIIALIHALRLLPINPGLIYVRAGIVVIIAVAGLSGAYSQQFLLSLPRGKAVSLPGTYGLPQSMTFSRLLLTPKKNTKGTILYIKDREGRRRAVVAPNKPLRYGAFSFYPSGGGKEPSRDISELLVVRNPFRQAMLVGGVVMLLGLLIHFLTPLIKSRGVSQSKKTFEKKAPGSPQNACSLFTAFLTIILVFAFLKIPENPSGGMGYWFTVAAFTYCAASLLYLITLSRFSSKVFTFTAGLLLCIGFSVHTAGLIRLAYVNERIPLGTLYETFLIAPWVGIVLGFPVARFFKMKEATVIAACLGTLLLLLAQMYKPVGAVRQISDLLDSPFWLGAHVSTIILGYSGFLGASLAGHAYLISRMKWGTTTQAAVRTFKVMRGFMRSGYVFAVIGVMLGALWAEHSWGRFWGWDPKENGALVLILWATISFIAFKKSLIGKRALALCASALTSLVMLTWIGVNLAAKGLHSYGLAGRGKGFLITLLVVEAFFYLFSAIWLLLHEKSRHRGPQSKHTESSDPRMTTIMPGEKQMPVAMKTTYNDNNPT